MTDTRTIGSTYRLQLGPELTFADVGERIGYFADLGITHLYLSPLLTARQGSTHGYDVADPTIVSQVLGGEAGLRALAEAAHGAGLGLVVDIVPNHLGTGPENPLWELLLAEGRAGEGGRVFDVDWSPPLPAADGKVILPVLGDQYGEVLNRGELRIVDEPAGSRLRYYDHSFPLSPETCEALERAGGAGVINGRPGEPESWVRLHNLLENQHYRLVFWRVGDRLINYRRFFAIDQLAGIKVEDEHVFDATHETILRLVRDGVVDGLRIDHPDGLRDPREYLERLAEKTGGIWNVVEKITHPGELLPESWKTAGTTGYEFTNDVLGLFVDPDAEALFDDLHGEMGGDARSYDEQVVAAKFEKLGSDLYADVQRLARRFWALCQHHIEIRDIDELSCYEVVSRMLVHLPVYRTYVDPTTGDAQEADVEHLRFALAAARENAIAPDRVYVLLANILAGRAGHDPAHLDFLARFQQLSGALTAKGVEDTVFYRHRRLLALNEVGGDPTQFGISVAEFHRRNAVRAARHPAGMLTTATHDTKRGEDVRLRVAALTELGERWAVVLRSWRGRAQAAEVDLPTASLLFQTLVGVWPLAESGRTSDGLRARLREYLEKATREAGERTSWVDPAQDYEERLGRFVETLLRDEAFVAELNDLAAAANEIAMVAGLAQVLLRTMSPGVPDLYQGNELWDDSLVDPDNRRPVDFAQRAEALAGFGDEVDPGLLWKSRHDGRLKLWVLRQALQVRRAHVDYVGVGSGYQPLPVDGVCADHLVVFARTDEVGTAGVIVVAPRLPGRTMGEDLSAPVGPAWEAAITLPEGTWRDALTGRSLTGGQRAASQVLGVFPVALLIRQD